MGEILTSIKLEERDRAYLRDHTMPYIDCMRLGILVMKRADDEGMQPIPWIQKNEARAQLCNKLLTFLGNHDLIDEWRVFLNEQISETVTRAA